MGMSQAEQEFVVWAGPVTRLRTSLAHSYGRAATEDHLIYSELA